MFVPLSNIFQSYASNMHVKAKLDQIAQRVVRGVEDTFLMEGARKKALATELIAEMLQEEGLQANSLQVDRAIERAVKRLKATRRRWVPLVGVIALALTNVYVMLNFAAAQLG